MKWGGFSLLTIFMILVIVLAISGLPKPPTIATAENIPRLPWSKVMGNVKHFRQMFENPSFATWLAHRDGAIIYAKSGFLEFGLFYQADTAAVPEELIGSPKRTGIGLVNPDPAHPYTVFMQDNFGDEMYQLSRYDFISNEVTPITNTPGRVLNHVFHPAGNNILFTATIDSSSAIYTINPLQATSLTKIYEARGRRITALACHPNQPIYLLQKEKKWNEEKFYILNEQTKSIEPLLADQEEDSAAYHAGFWSRDGRYLLYTTNRKSEFMQLHRYDFQTGKDTTLSGSIPWDVDNIYPLPDSEQILAEVNEGGFSSLFLVNILEGDIEKISDLPNGIYNVCVHPTKMIIGLTVYQSYIHSSIYEYNLLTKTLHSWKNMRGDKPTAPLAQVKLLEYPTFDSVDKQARTIPAFVFRVQNQAKAPYPVLIDLHGGPVSQSKPIVKPYELIMERGVVVITPNYRGSTGYGKSFEQLDNGLKREDAVKDIGALLDWIDKQPELDKNKVALIGDSYGGYLVLSTMAKYGERIRCGIVLAGVSNLTIALENSVEDVKSGLRDEFGDERDPAMRAFLDSISPLHQAHKIKSPLFIYHGLQDTRVFPSEARQMAEQLQATGQKVWYVEAEGEGHSMPPKNPLNLLYMTNAWIAFADHYLFDK